MTEKTFKTGIALLGKLFGKIDDELYKIYWNFLKSFSDKVFLTAINDLAMSFNPTSQVPFPTLANFNKLRDDIVRRTQFDGSYLPYKPDVIDPKDLPTPEFLEEWKHSLPAFIRGNLNN